LSKAKSEGGGGRIQRAYFVKMGWKAMLYNTMILKKTSRRKRGGRATGIAIREFSAERAYQRDIIAKRFPERIVGTGDLSNIKTERPRLIGKPKEHS